MARVRKQRPTCLGAGELRYRGFAGQVDYELAGEPSALRPGPTRLRGSLTATPEVAEQAFREGEGVLTLDSGVQFRITLLAHTAGSSTAYFEMRA
jgi:hypothetical protein